MTHTLAELEDTNTRIRILNDTFRKTGEGGETYLTRGIAELEAPMRATVLDVVRTFDDWSDDNDPWQQHDCAMFEVDSMRIMFKIDYYDLDKEWGSADPADSAVTTRVLTVMLADEY